MQLFPATRPHGLCQRERGSSSKPSRPTTANARSRKPPSPLAQHLTRQKPSPQAAEKPPTRKKNAVHPIDQQDLETELEQLTPRSQPAADDTNKEHADVALPRGFTVTVAVLHALDLHNPCQIRSCPHGFAPVALLTVSGSSPESFSATRHARNHTSWTKNARFSHHFPAHEAARRQLLRVDVVATCSRHRDQAARVVIGIVDDIALSPDQIGELSQFYPVFRYQTVQNRMIKYFAGKIKLSISIVTDATPSILETPAIAQPVGSMVSANPAPAMVAPARPSFLPLNLGEALQLKRKQLKATIAPDVPNRAITKSTEDPEKARALIDELQVKATGHTICLADVEVRGAVGEGIHATVFRVRVGAFGLENVDLAMKESRFYQEQATESESSPPFAVLQAFQQEYEMLSLVTNSSDHHMNCVSLVGAMLGPRFALFTDYCSDGSLAKCLADLSMWSNVSFCAKLELARQIAVGLAGLHMLHVVHRDIKTHNILIDGLLSRHPIAKIGDLGSAVVRSSTDAMLHYETGSSGYTAPEVFLPFGYDHRADIWSLGVVLWELLVQNASSTNGSQGPLHNPFAGACGDEVVQKAENGERPLVPDGALPAWCSALLQRCWQLEPTMRPAASDIALEIATALATCS